MANRHRYARRFRSAVLVSALAVLPMAVALTPADAADEQVTAQAAERFAAQSPALPRRSARKFKFQARYRMVDMHSRCTHLGCAGHHVLGVGY